MPTGQRAQGEFREQVCDWFEDGNKGSRMQVANFFGVTKEHASHAIRQLVAANRLHVVYQSITPESRGVVVDILGFKEKAQPKFDVRHVIANQPPLVKAWHGAAS